MKGTMTRVKCNLMADSDSDSEDLHEVKPKTARVKNFRHKVAKTQQAHSIQSVSSDEDWGYCNKNGSSLRKKSKCNIFARKEMHIRSSFSPKIKQFESEDEPIVPVFPHNEKLSIAMLPTSIVLSADAIPDDIVHDFVFNGAFQIGITAVYSPYKFWFYLQAENNIFSKLEDEMKDFYGSCDRTTFAMSTCDVKQDNVAVVFVGKTYKRVRILHCSINKYHFVNVQSTARVFAIDYGDILDIETKDLLYLEKSFAETPRLCHRGRLALVVPFDSNRWRLRDTFEFRAQTKEKTDQITTLTATLHAFEEVERIHHVLLKNYNDVSLGKTLEGLGCCRMVDAFVEKWPEKDELYPTFDLLEACEADDVIYTSDSIKYLKEEHKKYKRFNCMLIN